MPKSGRRSLPSCGPLAVIIKTALNPHAGNLYRHLTRTDDGNEKVRLVEVRGCVSEDLLGSLREMKATAAGSRCTKSFYHVSFAAPPADASRLQGDETWLYCANQLEREFGLENHARAVVHHFKDGRWHQHVVWNRMDPETGKAAQLSHEHRRAIKVARALERDLGLTPVSNERPPQRQGQRPPKPWEAESARRTKVDADLVRDEIRASWQSADSGQAFVAALQERGLLLAKGDQRPYVILDGSGNFYALSGRVLPGESSRTILDRLWGMDGGLPTLEEGRALIAERKPGNRHKRGRKGKGGDGQADLTLDYAQEHGALKRQYEADRLALDERHTKERRALAKAHAREMAGIGANKPSLLARLTGAAELQRQKDEARERQIRAEADAQHRDHLNEREELRKRHDVAVAQLREREKEERRQLQAAAPKPKPSPKPAAEKPRRGGRKKVEPSPSSDPSAARAWEKQRQAQLQQEREARQAEARAARPPKGRGRRRTREPE